MGDLGEIVRVIGREYLRTRRVTPTQRKALWAIGRCRTAEMGFVEVLCEECASAFPLFRSCRNRNCPQCQGEARAKWLAGREQELLPVPYFHVVFTVPEVLNTIALYCPEIFYAALLRAAGQTLLDVGLSKLEARLGALVILHTWGQNLSLHPHAHCVVPGGGFSTDRTRWISVPNPEYLLPIEVLMQRFRTLLCRSLRGAARKGRLHRLPATVSALGLIENAAEQRWIVYAKAPFGGPEQVLEYLSRYTHRVAISNRRILSFEEGKVTFEWRDYRDDNRVKQSTIEGEEFLRRFLLHVLPNRFVHIRYFGYFANRHRRTNIERARGLIGRCEELRFRDRSPFRRLCPECYAKMMANNGEQTETTAALRSPPLVTAA